MQTINARTDESSWRWMGKALVAIVVDSSSNNVFFSFAEDVWRCDEIFDVFFPSHSRVRHSEHWAWEYCTYLLTLFYFSRIIPTVHTCTEYIATTCRPSSTSKSLQRRATRLDLVSDRKYRSLPNGGGWYLSFENEHLTVRQQIVLSKIVRIAVAPKKYPCSRKTPICESKVEC